MSASTVWSWADVPGLDAVPAASTPLHQRKPGGGRPKHPVTMGDHDATIVPMTRRGDPISSIAALLDCSAGLVARRLQALGVECFRK